MLPVNSQIIVASKKDVTDYYILTVIDEIEIENFTDDRTAPLQEGFIYNVIRKDR